MDTDQLADDDVGSIGQAVPVSEVHVGVLVALWQQCTCMSESMVHCSGEIGGE